MSDTYSPEQLVDLLVEGARLDGRPTTQAAVHLLTYTAFVHQLDASDLVEFDNDDDPDAPVTAAFVRDWPKAESIAIARRWGGAGERLTGLAASLATGEPVDLRNTLPGLGSAHARRVIEAVVIATGTAHLYEITGTAVLDQLNAEREALSRG